MLILIRILLSSVITCAGMLLMSQLIVWGLGIYHVSSGIWPVWLIGCGVEGILAIGVAVGVQAAKD